MIFFYKYYLIRKDQATLR